MSKSDAAKLMPALVASPSRSHVNFERSKNDFTSAPEAAIVSKFVPAKIICLLSLLYSTPVIVVVGITVSIEIDKGSLEVLPIVAVIVSAPSPIFAISPLVTATDQSPLLSTVAVLPPARAKSVVLNDSVSVSPTFPRPLMVKPSAASTAFTLLSVSIVVMVIPDPAIAKDKVPVADAPSASSTTTENVSVTLSARSRQLYPHQNYLKCTYRHPH